MNLRPGQREAETKSFVNDQNLMREHTQLPDLDYTKLAIGRLRQVKTAVQQAPAGRYDSLVEYLKQRGSAVDAAEVDRRLRTWFEDVINKILQDPAQWDQQRTLDGKVLMDFLSGIEKPATPAPPQENA